MSYSVIDIETNGLLENVTKIHCMSVLLWTPSGAAHFAMTGYDDMRTFLLSQQTLVGHNIIRYDIPVLEKLLDIDLSHIRKVDTLGLSWYLYPQRETHGLESWGETFGIPKPKITDWKNLPVEDYIHRCNEDVQINFKLYQNQCQLLAKIYDGNVEAIKRITGYLSYKLECAREQEELGWKLDVGACKENLRTLQAEKESKRATLQQVMPVVHKTKIVSRPEKLYKKNGEVSEAGKKWFALMEAQGLPPWHMEAVKVITDTEAGNPNSHAQLKAWLHTLGWKPATFKYVKDSEDAPLRKIEQLTDNGGLCESVKLLFEKEPKLEVLEGLFVISHRIGILEGFLRDVDSNGMLKACVHGFTNTLRFQHTVIVNLPTIHKPHGKMIRECLISPDKGWKLCGADMSSLEDNTKQHYMYYFDPQYVKEMRTPGYDPHLDIAQLAGMLTPEQVQAHKDGTENHSKVRKDAKVVNFSAVYGVGVTKMALTTGWTPAKCKALLETYWQRNWAVKKVANALKTKTIEGQAWVYNPVSKFWYSLRFEKDKFSTLNQGTGVYCFDTWINNVRKRGMRICGQFHDEIIIPIPERETDICKTILKEAIRETNDYLKLNVELGISIDIGDNYAQIH